MLTRFWGVQMPAQACTGVTGSPLQVTPVSKYTAQLTQLPHERQFPM
jgi:hypothetical protein